jgi:peptidoglycan hydrolase CwlO-like protein
LPAVQRLLRATLLGALAVGFVASATAANAAPAPADLQSQIDQSSAALEKIVENYNGITEQLKTTQAQADDLATKMAPLQKNLDAAYANVSQIAVRAYQRGAFSPTAAVLLSDSSSSGLLDELSTFNQVARSQQRDIDAYGKMTSQYDGEKKRLDDLLTQQKADQKNLADQKTKIEGDLARLMELRKQAYGSATQTTPAYTGSIPSIPGSAGVAVSFAYR